MTSDHTYGTTNISICAIILNYYGHYDTIECVQSLLAQKAIDSIVIVENSGSEDELLLLYNQFVTDELVTIIHTKQNLGFAGGVNFAITAIGIGSFDTFLIVNNDTVLPSGSVHLLKSVLCTNNYDVIAPTIYCYPERNVVWSSWNYYNKMTGLITKNAIKVLPLNIRYLTGCCLLIRSRVFDGVGLFDESFFMYGEDVEFCFRATQGGFKYGLAHEAIIFHKGSGSAGNNSLFYEHHINLSHLLLCRKLARTSKEARISLVLKVNVLLLRAIWRVFRYGNLNALRGLMQSIATFLV